MQVIHGEGGQILSGQVPHGRLKLIVLVLHPCYLTVNLLKRRKKKKLVPLNDIEMNGLAPPDHHIPEYGSQRLFGTDR